MISALIELAVWMIVLPLALGLVAASRQNRLVSLRRQRTGDGWSASDTFEVKDAIFGTAAFCFPMALTFSFWSAGLDLPSWQWWGAVVSLLVVGSLPMQLHSLWHVSQRKSLGIADPPVVGAEPDRSP